MASRPWWEISWRSLTKPGTLHIAKASPEGYQELARLDLFEEQSWSALAFAGGKLYARSMAHLARIDPTGSSTESTPPVSDTPEWWGSTQFGQFLVNLGEEDDPTAALESYLEEQGTHPFREAGGVVHFVFETDGGAAGIVGDMIGYRREDAMTPIPGTDYFYYTTRLEPDAAVAYGFIPAFGEVQADPRGGEEGGSLFGDASWLTQPAWERPAHEIAGAPAAQGRLESVNWKISEEDDGQREAKIYLAAGL